MSRAKGSEAEERVVEYLQAKGYRVVVRNFYTRFGEIDIVALKDGVLHFVEVKSGKGEPIYRITPQKLSKIIKTAEIYLQKAQWDGDFCFDALVVADGGMEHIENITL